MNKKKITFKKIPKNRILKPNVNNSKLTEEIFITDENNQKIKVHSIVEKPLTLYLNDQDNKREFVYS